MKLYHASPNQNLEYIDPNKQNTTPNTGDAYEKKKEVYASEDKSYAAGFCFNWNAQQGFRFSCIDGVWEIKVPPKYAQKLNYPCSIYEVETKGFINLNMSTPEFASTIKVKVINEEKYNSCYDCLKQNGVIISILKRKPFMDNALIKKFRNKKT